MAAIQKRLNEIDSEEKAEKALENDIKSVEETIATIKGTKRSSKKAKQKKKKDLEVAPAELKTLKEKVNLFF